ncbi:MAG: mechanosensitive ion channel family protein [Anaerolineales bacterium]|nr:mechanosensitive ion channel family protein [Anaerolineales bacterium]
MENWFRDLLDNVAAWLPNILIALLILVGSILLARLLSTLLDRTLKRHKASPEASLLLTRTTLWAIIIIGIITALQRFFDITAFLAGLGILGFTIGFALQNIMQNFASGIILLIQQPFNIGDAVEVSDYGGTVLVINLRTTELRTWDGRIVIIPNAEIIGNVIVNHTRADRRRIEVPVGVGYGTDLNQAREVILKAIPALPGFITEPAPMVVADTFAESAVNLTVYFWIDNTSHIGLFEAKDGAMRLIKAALDGARIDLPFPTRTIYMHDQA